MIIINNNYNNNNIFFTTNNKIPIYKLKVNKKKYENLFTICLIKKNIHTYKIL